jgi:hypothetical protein
MSNNLSVSVNKQDWKPAWMNVDMVMSAVILCIGRRMYEYLMWGTFKRACDRSNMYFLIVCVLKVVFYLLVVISI